VYKGIDPIPKIQLRNRGFICPDNSSGDEAARPPGMPFMNWK